MKKLMAMAMALAITGGMLAGCGGGGSETSAAPEASAAAEEGSGAATADEITSDQSGAVLGEADASAVENKRTDLRICLAASPETIDPTMNSSLDGANYVLHLFEGLYRYKRDGSGVEFGVAESADISEDGMTWTFHLRDDAKWSDGQPVTAHDFEYTWKRLCDPATAAPYALDMGGFLLNGADVVEGKKAVDELGVTALDDLTFEVKLEGPCSFFDQIAAFPTFSPVRKDTIEANGAERWATSPDTYISNGAFKLSEFTLDSQLVLVPNENYYEVDTIVPTSITCLFLADENAELSAFRSGETDFSEQAPQEETLALINEGVAEYRFQLGTYYMSMNCEKAPFDDVNVRKAFSLAIDRDYIANVVREGSVYPAYAYVGNGYNDATPEQDFREVGGHMLPEDYAESVAQAREALAAAGYKTPDHPDGKDFPVVEYMYNEGTGHQLIAQAMQQQWVDALGIDVQLVSQEWNVFLDSRRKGDYFIARDGWIADYTDASSLLTLNMSSSGNNNSQYRSDEYDAYMKEAALSADQAVRVEAMHKAEQLLVLEDAAVAPIYYYADQLLFKPELSNWGYTPVGYKFFHHAFVAE